VATLTLAEVKAALNITSGGDDAELQAVISAVDEGVNVMCGYSESTPFTETRRSTNGHIIVRRRPILSVTSITGQRYGALSVAGIFFTEESSIIRSTYTGLTIEDDWYTVVYNAGRASTSAAIKHGSQIIIQHQWQVRRGVSPGGSRSPGQGGQDDVSTVPGVSYAVPNRAIQIFRDAGYMRGPLVA
jgi:hypothetical protein